MGGVIFGECSRLLDEAAEPARRSAYAPRDAATGHNVADYISMSSGDAPSRLHASGDAVTGHAFCGFVPLGRGNATFSLRRALGAASPTGFSSLLASAVALSLIQTPRFTALASFSMAATLLTLPTADDFRRDCAPGGRILAADAVVWPCRRFLANFTRTAAL